MLARRQIGDTQAQVRYELNTAYFPITTDYIANRIGGPDPGVGARHWSR